MYSEHKELRHYFYDELKMHLIHFLNEWSDLNFRIVNVHVEMKMSNTINLFFQRSLAIEKLDLDKFNALNEQIKTVTGELEANKEAHTVYVTFETHE